MALVAARQTATSYEYIEVYDENGMICISIQIFVYILIYIHIYIYVYDENGKYMHIGYMYNHI